MKKLPWPANSLSVLKNAMAVGSINIDQHVPQVLRNKIFSCLKYDPYNRMPIQDAYTLIKEVYDKYERELPINQEITSSKETGLSLKTFSGSFYGSSTSLPNNVTMNRTRSKYKIGVKMISGNYTHKSDTFVNIDDDEDYY